MIPAMWKCFVTACASGQIDDATQQRAADRLAADAACKARVRAKAAPRRDTRAATRADRLARLLVIRTALLEETSGTCAVCSVSIGAGASGDHKMEAHHLISGGLRRHEERKETMAALCGSCHRAAHRGDVETLRALLAFCVRTGRQMAAKALEKRLAKIDEARRSA